MDSTFSVRTDDKTFELSHAILMYSEKTYYGDGANRAYATVHEVIENKAGRNEIREGVPATHSAIARLMAKISGVQSRAFIPERVLVRELDGLIWWTPPGTRPIFFATDGRDKIGTQGKVVAHPALVFMVHGDKQQWHVFAVRGDKRPTADTPLCYAPYYNVSENGSICVGNATTPNASSIDSIDEWDVAFFNSSFTHSNYHAAKACRHRSGLGGMWREVLKNPPAVFPDKYLLGNGLSIKGLLEKW